MKRVMVVLLAMGFVITSAVAQETTAEKEKSAAKTACADMKKEDCEKKCSKKGHREMSANHKKDGCGKNCACKMGGKSGDKMEQKDDKK